MEDQNRESEPTAVTPPEESTGSGEPGAASGSFRTPAEYYEPSSEAAEPPKSGRRWWIGCGALGCVVILGIFVGGALMVARPHKLFGFVVSSVERDLDRFVVASVPVEEKEALRRELGLLKVALQQKRVEIIGMQPLILELNRAIRDQKLTREEVDHLTTMIEKINRRTGSSKKSA